MNTVPNYNYDVPDEDYGILPDQQPPQVVKFNKRTTTFEEEHLAMQERHHKEDLEAREKTNQSAERLANAMEDAKAAIFIGRRRIKPINQFVLLFYENLREIIEEFDLNTTNLRVLLVLIEKMEFGNLVQLNQSALAKELGMQRQNLHRAFKKLKEVGLLLEVDSSLYINPHVIAKGSLLDQKLDEEAEPSEVYSKITKQSKEKGINQSF